MAATINPQGNRLAYLDGMRGLAALVVAVVFHYVHFSDQFQPGGVALERAPLYDAPAVQLLYSRGYLGVDLFFLISGFIFAHVYGDAIAARRVHARAFLVRRVSRLYPLHLLTLLATVAMVVTFESLAHRPPIYAFNGLREFVLNLLFIQNGTLERGANFNGPAWSLSVEAAAYVLFFVYARTGMNLGMVGVLLLAGVAMAMFARAASWAPMGVSSDIGRGVAGFFLGVLLYRLRDQRPLLLVLGLALVPAIAWFVVPHLPHPEQAWSLAIAWCGFGWILLALDRFPILRRPFETAPARSLGDLSLAIYLVHVPLQMAILLFLLWLGSPPPASSPLFMLGYAAAVLAVAWLAHRLIERPAQRALRQHFDRT